MNKRFLLYLMGTKVQDFMASTLSFSFLLLFYQLSDSVLYSGALTAISVVASRVIMFFVVPLCRSYSPIRVTFLISFGVGFASLVAAVLLYLGANSIYFYLICSILFTIFQEMKLSFSSSIIPRIVDQAYLFKANSLNGVFYNVSLMIAPLLSYLFTVQNVGVLFMMYCVVSLGSALLLMKLERSYDEIPISDSKPSAAKKLRFFTDQWFQTIRMIRENKAILYCISLGVLLNTLFAGINGPFLLKEGNGGLGSTLIKVSLSIGSLLGVYGAFVLKVKEKYQWYLKISIIGVALSLLLPVVWHNTYFLLVCMVTLTLFVMFIMNTTGTLLQVVTPLQELPAVYEIRSTLYSIVVPLSYVAIGWVLERWSYEPYFLLSAFLLLTVGMVIGKNGKKTTTL